jgi:hypothetical protein
VSTWAATGACVRPSCLANDHLLRAQGELLMKTAAESS